MTRAAWVVALASLWVTVGCIGTESGNPYAARDAGTYADSAGPRLDGATRDAGASTDGGRGDGGAGCTDGGITCDEHDRATAPAACVCIASPPAPLGPAPFGAQISGPTPSGGFVAVYVPAAPSSTNLAWQRFDATGAAIGAATDLGAPFASPRFRAALEGDTLGVVWWGIDAADGVTLARVNVETGAAIGAPQPFLVMGEPVALSASAGVYGAITWRGGAFWFERLAPDGTLVAGPTSLASGPASPHLAQIVPRAASFAAVVQTETETEYFALAADGSIELGPIVVATRVARAISMRAISEGYVLGWSTVDRTGADAIDLVGRTLGSAIVWDGASAGPVDAAETGFGSIAVAWTRTLDACDAGLPSAIVTLIERDAARAQPDIVVQSNASTVSLVRVSSGLRAAFLDDAADGVATSAICGDVAPSIDGGVGDGVADASARD